MFRSLTSIKLTLNDGSISSPEDSRNQVSTLMINTSLHENIHDQTTLTCGNEMEIWDVSGQDNTTEVGRA